ncbi:MAG: hypothetical protein MK008_04320 [Bdellovibrionales bacterium]|nr:hypothetical protein [Bdellovibrionales bacterium]
MIFIYQIKWGLIVDGQNVIEKITLNFGGQNLAQLFIPEVYSEKSRSGEGYIQLESDPRIKANLNFQVLYE